MGGHVDATAEGGARLSTKSLEAALPKLEAKHYAAAQEAQARGNTEAAHKAAQAALRLSTAGCADAHLITHPAEPSKSKRVNHKDSFTTFRCTLPLPPPPSPRPLTEPADIHLTYTLAAAALRGAPRECRPFADGRPGPLTAAPLGPPWRVVGPPWRVLLFF